MAPFRVSRTNTILYCARWTETVVFYRDTLGLRPTHSNDWFVEFHLAGPAHLSVANADRATITPAGGAGITISLQVDDLDAAHANLLDLGLDTSAPAERWGSRYLEFRDPEGTRIELWSADDEPV